MRLRLLAAGLAGVVFAGSACGLPDEPADIDAPFVAITSPTNGATVSGLVVFSAQVLDGFGIARVRFLIDGSEFAVDFTEPYSVNWNTVTAGNGPHALRVEAVDLSGNTGFSSIGVTVDNTPN